jgi:hypothetical protein
LVAASGTARAGRTFYGWLYGTEVMPERGVELETWIDERNIQFQSTKDHETTWWVGALVGITDQLELALPIESKWYTEENPAAGFVGGTVAPQRYGVELRYRFVTQDPEHAPAFVPLVRVAIKRDITGALRPEADIVASYSCGRVHVSVDAGIVADVSTSTAFTATNGTHHVEFHPALGASIRVVGDLRLGAEAFGELSLDANEDGHSWAAAGPNIAWTHGRFWLSGAYGIGVYGIQSAPRLVWGVAF